ncbi:Oidioi.mRNA.OKI2018_I69.chr2.g8311.t1.cds [Oikopleura dioica]|uniref:Oidioi.mRNA.OKI2018_I69.chr2.g8311.t1.cds n=1 Tax=Oikopleura dioica TaxID=34765 RepID=A0ABN7T9T9_OIKDI|nr:Oidioi.mRNA.OKI2018_I69.chr2.g8311.t1.cds [Oikopleura dioica]
MVRKLLLWLISSLIHYGESKDGAIRFYDSSEENFAQLRSEITRQSTRRKRKRSLASRSDKELIVEKEGRRHLLLLKQIRVIDEENYELRVPHDFDELSSTDEDSVIAENCTYFGRTYHDRYSSAFVNICEQTGFIEDRQHGRIDLDFDDELEAARRKVNGEASCGENSEQDTLPRDFRTSRHFTRPTRNSHTRRKRYVVPRELRVAVFVDPSMTRFFRQLGSSVISIENYLAKIMARDSHGKIARGAAFCTQNCQMLF